MISPWHRPPPPWCFASSQSFLQLWLPLVPLLRTLRTRTIAPRADVGSRTRTPLHWASRLPTKGGVARWTRLHECRQIYGETRLACHSINNSMGMLIKNFFLSSWTLWCSSTSRTPIRLGKRSTLLPASIRDDTLLSHFMLTLFITLPHFSHAIKDSCQQLRTTHHRGRERAEYRSVPPRSARLVSEWKRLH